MSSPWPRSFTFPDRHPRPLSEVQSERSYLLNTLNMESQKATDLLRQISPLEQLLMGDATVSQKRKARMHLGWLKHRFEQARRQEQTILQRHGQLTWEIQKRQRLDFLEEERRLAGQGVRGGMQSSPAVPEFYPQRQPQHHIWQAPGVRWQHVPWLSQKPQHADGFVGKWSPTKEKEDAELAPEIRLNKFKAEGLKENLDTKKRRPPLAHRPSSMDQTATSDFESSGLKVKRNSLPSLPTLPGIESFWKPTKEEAETGMERGNSGREYL